MNLEEDVACIPFQASVDARGVSVPRDIGEGLLKDAKNGRG
jgi:hypothetical protein